MLLMIRVHMELTCTNEPTHQLVNAVNGPVVLVAEPLHTLKALGQMRREISAKTLESPFNSKNVPITGLSL